MAIELHKCAQTQERIHYLLHKYPRPCPAQLLYHAYESGWSQKELENHSTHKDGSGIGLSSISIIAEKYGGMANFSHTADKFSRRHCNLYLITCRKNMTFLRIVLFRLPAEMDNTCIRRECFACQTTDNRLYTWNKRRNVNWCLRWKSPADRLSRAHQHPLDDCRILIKAVHPTNLHTAAAGSEQETGCHLVLFHPCKTFLQ